MEEHENQYPVGFYFSISFDGSDATAFQEVSGISYRMNEGEIGRDENQFTSRVPTTTSSANLTLKRGVTLKGSSLHSWCADTLEGGLSTPIQAKNISVSLLDHEGKVSMKWVFYSAYPVKYSVSSLGSQQNEILIESLELAYAYFDRKQS